MTTPLVTPVMGIRWPCIFGKKCFDIVSIFRFPKSFFQVWDDLIESILVDLCEIWLGDSLWCKLQGDQWRLTRASVLLAPLLALDWKTTSLSYGIHMWVKAVGHDVFSSMVFLLYFSLLILWLPLLGVSSKSTCLSCGFCVHSPRQCNTISWKLNLIFPFFCFFLVNCLWRMESINVTGVLQEAGDTDSRAFTRSQV